MKDSEMKRMREAKEVAGERAVDFSLDAPPLPDDERIAHARRNGYAARGERRHACMDPCMASHIVPFSAAPCSMESAFNRAHDRPLDKSGPVVCRHAQKWVRASTPHGHELHRGVRRHCANATSAGNIARPCAFADLARNLRSAPGLNDVSHQEPT
jgi:hypothetical protein